MDLPKVFMGIQYVSGDILAAPVEMLVNPVNCVGVMGRGLALQFHRAFPSVFNIYHGACARGEVVPGRVLTIATGVLIPTLIAHVPTKRHWRDRSRLDDVVAGLVALAAEIDVQGVHSVAVPALGCGLGELSWDIVQPEIERALGSIAADVIVYVPQ